MAHVNFRGGESRPLRRESRRRAPDIHLVMRAPRMRPALILGILGIPGLMCAMGEAGASFPALARKP